MRYKLLLITALLLFVFFPFARVYSQTPTGSASSSTTTAPLDESEMNNVKKIIDMVASNSAEQKSASKIGVIGTVVEKTTTTLNLATLNGDNMMIDTDEITKFSDPNSKSFGISDIKTGETLGVMGILNTVSSHILARFVDRLDSIPTRFEGVITDVDKVNYQYTAVDENGNKMVLDIQTASKIFSFTKTDGQLKSGFSKADVGERVYASGFPDKKIKNQLEISDLILFPEIPPSPKMQKYAPAATPNPSPTPSVKPTTSR